MVATIGQWRRLAGLAILFLGAVTLTTNVCAAAYDVRVTGASIEVRRDGGAPIQFDAAFALARRADDPQVALRPSDLSVSYNVPTWKLSAAKVGTATALGKKPDAATVKGDGLDQSILQGDTKNRTADVFVAAQWTELRATNASRRGNTWEFVFPNSDMGRLTASLEVPSDGSAPVLEYRFVPAVEGYFGIGFVGAPAVTPVGHKVFQPLVWHSEIFPDQSYVTLAFRETLPTTFVEHGDQVVGVVVDPSEFPFQPLPTFANSRFGVAIRDQQGNARPMVFAPSLGALGSQMKIGDAFDFKLRLFVQKGSIIDAFQSAAHDLYGFSDFRCNTDTTLNQTLDNIIAYGLSPFSRFREAMKGCAYDTDAPGTIKNVSSLNPIDLAIVTDDETLFDRRAYPYVEYMVSRTKFLFTLDENQKIQNPSYTLKGPCAPVSELAALYNLFGKGTKAFLDMAEQEYGHARERNLDVVDRGDTWENALWMYRATGKSAYLDAAKKGADAYIAKRIETPQTKFKNAYVARPFFWTAFAPEFATLCELYETTNDQRYLDAAHEAARRFTLYTWMAPRVPDEKILVNPGGMAPIYGYLRGKGAKPMAAPEESVPAWRLSEMGLTSEASGTSTGHRAIFMANYAPWLLRIGYLTHDAFLRQIAWDAIVGRYASFPGYHMNTARTTVYEKAGYPLHERNELSVNSFHYNHVWPMASMLLDYLVTDAYARSDGQIDFKGRFIEGYAYMQNRAYGGRTGRFYNHEDAILWMPKGLITTSSVQVNYIAARGDGRLYVALMNQSKESVKTTVTIAAVNVPSVAGKTLAAQQWRDNVASEAVQFIDGKATVTIAPRGITVLIIEGAVAKVEFQQKLMGLNASDAWQKGYIKFGPFAGRAMVLNLGPAAKTIYTYLENSKHDFSKVTLNYSIDGGKTVQAIDDAFPWEFTIPLPPTAKRCTLQYVGTNVDGKREQRSDEIQLSE